MFDKLKSRLIRTIFGILVNFLPKVNLRDNREAKAELCTLLGSSYVGMYIAAVSSFAYFNKFPISALVVDDGTLTANDVQRIKKKLIGVRVIYQSEAEKAVLSKLARFPKCYRYRKQNSEVSRNFNKKLFDLLLLSHCEKIIYFDADILFFKKAKKVESWINFADKGSSLYMAYDNTFWSEGEWWGLVVLNLLGKLWKIRNSGNFNAGFMCFLKEDISLRKIESLLSKIYQLGLDKIWFMEQVIFSVLVTAEKKSRELPIKKYVMLTNDSSRSTDVICIHYHGDQKEKMMSDFIKEYVGLFR